MLLFNEDLEGFEDYLHLDDPELSDSNEDMTEHTDNNDSALSNSDHETSSLEDQFGVHILDQQVDISHLRDEHFEHTGIDEPSFIDDEEFNNIGNKLDEISSRSNSMTFTGNDCSCSGNCYSVCVESCASHCSASYSN
jgi:hypothetical protein